MLINKSKRKKIEKTIDKFFNAIIFKIAGSSEITASERKELEEEGIIGIYEAQRPYSEEAYYIGRIRNPLAGKYEKSDLNKFRVFDSRNYVPLGEKEKFAIANAKESMGVHIAKLKANVKGSVLGSIADANNDFAQKTLMQSLSSITEDNIAKRKGVRKLAVDLRDATGDMNRDWQRVASTELSSAFNNGAADAIAARNKGKDAGEVLAYKIVSKDAALCKYCRGFYLMPNGENKVYKLSQLKANGTNYGKKASEWKPVIGPTHPNCFIDGRVKVYTSTGWKQIRDIKIGEFVLSHKGKFKRVINTIQNQVQQNPELYSDKYGGDVYKITYNLKRVFGGKNNLKRVLKVTPDHKFLTQRGWIEAQNLSNKDEFFQPYFVSDCCNDDVIFLPYGECSGKCKCVKRGNWVVGNRKGKNTEEYRQRVREQMEKRYEGSSLKLNHGDRYGFDNGVEILSVEKFKHGNLKHGKYRECTLYDITVEDDESFIVEGVVSHNCRCTLVELPKGWGFKEGTQRPTFEGMDFNILKEQKTK